MGSHATAQPFCSSCSAQAAASEVLPNPAGALMTPSCFAGSPDSIASSRGRATSPPGRAGTILVARNGSRPSPARVPIPAPIASRPELAPIKGTPFSRRPSPHPGDTRSDASVRSQLARGKGRSRWRQALGAAITGCRALVVQLHTRTTTVQYPPGGAKLRLRLECVGIAGHKKSALEAMAGDEVHRKLKFGPFELSSGERVLQRDGATLPLGSRALDILIYLAERPGEVVAKN